MKWPIFSTILRLSADALQPSNLKNVSIILSRPRYPENIGAAARAMRNMGFEQLIVVDPQNYDMPRVLKMATHAAAEVVEQIQVYENLQHRP